MSFTNCWHALKKLHSVYPSEIDPCFLPCAAPDSRNNYRTLCPNCTPAPHVFFPFKTRLYKIFDCNHSNWPKQSVKTTLLPPHHRWTDSGKHQSLLSYPMNAAIVFIIKGLIEGGKTGDHFASPTQWVNLGGRKTKVWGIPTKGENTKGFYKGIIFQLSQVPWSRRTQRQALLRVECSYTKWFELDIAATCYG